jgi:hypothetical protein
MSASLYKFHTPSASGSYLTSYDQTLWKNLPPAKTHTHTHIHRTESFLRSNHILSYSRNSPYFTEREGSSLYSPVLILCQIDPVSAPPPHLTSRRSILTLSTHTHTHTRQRLHIFHNVCCHSSFSGPKVSAASVVSTSQVKTPGHGSDSQLPASRHGGLGTISGQSMWNLEWTKWHWDRICSKYFSFPLSGLYS